MLRILTLYISTFLLAFFMTGTARFADLGAKKMRTALLSNGSVPPGRMLLACAHELDGMPFSDSEINNCASKLRGNYFIKDVQVKVLEPTEDWILVEFILSGEPLNLEELTFDSFDEDPKELLKFLSLNSSNLRLGGTYSWEAQSSTSESIRVFYRARGILVGVIPKLRMDYKQRKAWINFRIVRGPRIPAHPLVPPYVQGCSDQVSVVDWLGTNDSVPVELVESGLELKFPFSCFSDQAAKRDKGYLSKMSILTTATVDYSGSAGSRQIHYKLNARPLRIQEINVYGFGELPPVLTDAGLRNGLGLKVGGEFSHSAAAQGVAYLKREFSPPDFWADVTVQEELSGTDGLSVTFSVLKIPLETILVDGKELK